MEYLIAIDLEGLHGVVGRPYEKLSRDTREWAEASELAIPELNAAISALFDAGADKVAVWDNHGMGNNIDFSKVDKRAIRIDNSADKYRFDFVKEHNFFGIIYLGYHSREGTIGGVLAHTYNSSSIQYARLGDKDVGELDIDTYITSEYGIRPLFCASDDKAISQMKELSPETEVVVTKYGHSRNSATLRPEAEVIAEIYSTVVRAAKREIPTVKRTMPEVLEVRYTRAELAESILEKTASEGVIPVSYGSDSHTLVFNVSAANQIPRLL